MFKLDLQAETDKFEQVGRGLLAEDLLRIATTADVAITPDGQWLAYSVKRCDGERNAYEVHLYLTHLKTRNTRELTQGFGSATSPAFSQDSQRLAYVWLTPTAWELRIVLLRAAQVTRYRAEGAPPAELNWSPDGQHIACSRWTTTRSGRESTVAQGVPAPTVRVVNRLRYKQDGAGWVHDRYQHIWHLSLGSGDWQPLTSGECDYFDPVWSPDGDRLAFTAVAREQNHPLGQGQILVWHDGHIAPLMSTWQGSAFSPQWRADGRAIAFAGYADPPPVNRRRFHHLWLYDLDRAEARELQGDLDNMVGAVGSRSLKWPTGQGPIWFPLTEHGATHLYSVQLDGAPECEVGGPCVVHAFAASQDGHVGYASSHVLSPGEVYLRQPDGRVERLTDLNPWLSSIRLSPPEEYWYPGLEGAKVHAWVIKPVGFEAKTRYPLILQVHCSMFSWDFNPEFQTLSSAGFVVAYFNQRGTTAGYGQKWGSGNYYGTQVEEVREIMLGVDDLIAKGYVDEARMGVTGGSCGGFLTNWVVGHTNRFRAAVTQRSVVDLVSKFGTSDNGPEQCEGEGGKAPRVDIRSSWGWSPLASAPNIQTPLLILHATEDHRVPLSQAEELFVALRWMDKEVELVIFDGESHELSRTGRPGNRIEHTRRILDWFRKHLGAGPSCADKQA